MNSMVSQFVYPSSNLDVRAVQHFQRNNLQPGLKD